MTGSDWSNQGRTSPNGTDEYKTTESQSQGVIAPTVVIAAAQDIYEDVNDNAKLGILIY